MLATVLPGCAGFGDLQQALRRNTSDDIGQQRANRKDKLAQDFDRQRDNAQFDAAASSWERGDVEGARKILDQLLDRNPNHRRARLLLADLYLFNGNAERSMQELNKALGGRSERCAGAPFAGADSRCLRPPRRGRGPLQNGHATGTEQSDLCSELQDGVGFGADRAAARYAGNDEPQSRRPDDSQCGFHSDGPGGCGTTCSTERRQRQSASERSAVCGRQCQRMGKTDRFVGWRNQLRRSAKSTAILQSAAVGH